MCANAYYGREKHYGKDLNCIVDGGYAYVVTPVTLAFSKSGKPIKEAAVVTLTLKKAEAGWRITGWAWAEQ